MTSVPACMGVANNTCSMDSGSLQSPARRYYGTSPSRRLYDSSSDVSYSERPLLQSAHTTPCRRAHYDACLQSEALWNGPRAAVVHRIQPATSAAPPQQQSAADNDEDKVDVLSTSAGCTTSRTRSQAQMVDVMSRILFPCIFLIFNIIYWPYYLFFCAP